MLCLAVYFKIIFLSGVMDLKLIHKPVCVDIHLLSEKQQVAGSQLLIATIP